MTFLSRFKSTAVASLCAVAVVALLALPAFAGLTMAQLKAKPFNILGQHGAIYKPRSKSYGGQQFLAIKKMASFLAGNLFGNLDNQIIVQQLAQQGLNASKNGSHIRLQLNGISTLGEGAYPVPKGLSPTQSAQYQHIRATFTAYDKATGQPVKGKDASRTMEVMAVRLTPNKGSEDIMTVFNLGGAVQKAHANQFLALMAANKL